MSRSQTLAQARALARSFEHYANPGREALLAMRRHSLLHGGGPAGAMEAWIEGKPSLLPPIPVPEEARAAAPTFRRLAAERDALSGAVPGSREEWTRNVLWSAMHVLAVQVVDPWWNGPRLQDIRFPNQMDWDYVSDRNGRFYEACWMARSNVSFLVATADESRIPDLSVPLPVPAGGARSLLSSEVAARIMQAGTRLGRAVDSAMEEAGYESNTEEAIQERVAIMADLESMGMYSSSMDGSVLPASPNTLHR